MNGPATTSIGALVLGALLLAGACVPELRGPSAEPAAGAHADPPGAVSNFTAAINRMVELVGLAGSGILALVWARVAFSWFSNDVSKKIQAKERARDALIGSLLFTAAVTGLIWGLAHWVVTGT
ncbi:MAG: hypothetical protein WBG19_07745 [Thermoplasmata archaeon]